MKVAQVAVKRFRARRVDTCRSSKEPLFFAVIDIWSANFSLLAVSLSRLPL
jgi:hypothetical protein